MLLTPPGQARAMKRINALRGLLSGLLLLAAGTFTAQAATYVFQQGAEITVDGVGTGVFYAGTRDTFIAPGNVFDQSGLEAIYLNANGSSGLLQFTDLFGTGTGQIAVGATATSVLLQVSVNDQGRALDYGRMLVSWQDSIFWGASNAGQPLQNAFGGNGVQYDNVEASYVGPTQIALFGSPALDVTSSLSDWALNPALNNGWVFIEPVAGNMGFRSSDFATVASRPKLTVIAVPEPSRALLSLVSVAAIGLRRRRS